MDLCLMEVWGWGELLPFKNVGTQGDDAADGGRAVCAPS